MVRNSLKSCFLAPASTILLRVCKEQIAVEPFITLFEFGNELLKKTEENIENCCTGKLAVKGFAFLFFLKLNVI